MHIGRITALGILLASGVSLSALGGGIRYTNDEGQFMELGGRIQVQYRRLDISDQSSIDRLFFRRLRPYFMGSLREDWLGKIQIELGAEEVDIRDVFMEYRGWEDTTLRIGNSIVPFAQAGMVSSKRLQLIERPLTGSHNFGVPDRQLGVHLDGVHLDKRFAWAVTAASAAIDPDQDLIDFDTVASINRSADWIEGAMLAGRVAYYPQGHFGMGQGDFKGNLRTTVAAAAYTWNNDNDNYITGDEPENDSVNGLELSTAMRGNGISVDAELNLIHGTLEEEDFTGGLYQNSETDILSWSISGGYMVLPDRCELVAGYSSLDADNYEGAWNRAEIGVNWFIQQHDIKLQAGYSRGENLFGRTGDDANSMYTQMQYVF